MRIKTITCHNVYNVGASLQAFALQKYLAELGHDVEIIDYKPKYLSGHYSLTSVNNPKYRKPLLREAYILLKLPKRIKELKSPKKAAFDKFTKENLRLTESKFESNFKLKRNCPEADLYIAGSDQIWNPLFENGKDPAFFLDFVPDGKMKVSYAASFAVEKLSDEDQKRDQEYLRKFDYISVRESSALDIVESMGLKCTHVCDPVFLLNSETWRKIAKPYICDKKYIFVYDFDTNQAIHQKIQKYASEHDLRILSAFPFDGGIHIKNLGPLEFLGIIAGAELVISNSFHATAFSIIMHKPFLVFNRKENINSRMRDLIQYFCIDNRSIIDALDDILVLENDWKMIEHQKNEFVSRSKDYVDLCLSRSEKNI